MFYRCYWRKVKTIFPIPMFLPILHASDIFIDPIIYCTNEKNNFKITKNDIKKILKKEKVVDFIYLCLLNNPTSIIYSKIEIESILNELFKVNKDIKVIIDWVYLAWWDVTQIHDIFKCISDNWWLNNIILVDWEWKAKARTWKRSGSVYIKDKNLCKVFSNIFWSKKYKNYIRLSFGYENSLF